MVPPVASVNARPDTSYPVEEFAEGKAKGLCCSGFESSQTHPPRRRVRPMVTEAIPEDGLVWLKALPEPCFLIETASGRILQASLAASEMLHYSHAELLSLTAQDLHPFEMRNFGGFVRSVLRQGQAEICGLTCRTSDGRFLPATINARRLQIGQQICLLAIARPEGPGHARHPETAVQGLADPREELARTRYLLHHAPENILWIRPDGTIIYANQTMADALGESCSELERKRIWEIDGDLDEPTFLAQIGVFRERRRMRFDRSLRRSDGTIFPVSVTMQLLQDGDEEIIISFSRDISEERQAREEARRYLGELARVSRQTAISEMASAIAHEIDQPLTAMLTWTRSCLRLLDAENLSPERLRHGLSGSLASAERIESIVGRLRHYMKTGEPQRERVPAENIITGCRELILAQTRHAGIRYVENVADNLPEVEVDTVLLQQVVLNLVRNAIEAMQSTPGRDHEIRLSVICFENDKLEMRLSDTGPGFNADQREHIFDPLFTTKGTGLGIGLSLCRSIIESHHGDIDLVEPPELSGATVRFTLPGDAPPR